jgi:hypothetical protein
MVSRKVQNSGILRYKLLKLILFYMTISLKLEFSPSHHHFFFNAALAIGCFPKYQIRRGWGLGIRNQQLALTTQIPRQKDPGRGPLFRHRHQAAHRPQYMASWNQGNLNPWLDRLSLLIFMGDKSWLASIASASA